MSFVPYQSTRRPKRQPLDQAQVVRAALTLLDELGLEELTMRRLAERLGIKAASLYRHVRSKEELLALLADEISAEIPLPRAAGRWQDQLIELARGARRGLLAHRDAARVLAMTMPFGPRRLRHIERLLAILEGAGLSGRDAVRAAYHLNNMVTEFVADEVRFGAAVAEAGSTRKRMATLARSHFKSLPPEEYPTIVRLADDLVEEDHDALFEFGVEIWLRGLEQVTKRVSKPDPPEAARRNPRTRLARS